MHAGRNVHAHANAKTVEVALHFLPSYAHRRSIPPNRLGATGRCVPAKLLSNRIMTSIFHGHWFLKKASCAAVCAVLVAGCTSLPPPAAVRHDQAPITTAN